MAAELIISISGMRGIIGENLPPTVAVEYGAAFGTFLKESCLGEKLTVAIGRDSRPSGSMLTSAVASGLCAVGVDAIDLGIVTTPTVGVITTNLKCAGGIVITASHNPIRYNGIKLLLGNGISPASDLAARIRQIYFAKTFNYIESINNGKVTCETGADAVHIDKVLAIVDKKKIATAKLKVVLDSVNGAGGRIGKELLMELGCEVVGVNLEPTGIFAHKPEPIAENLTSLSDDVTANSAAIGFAQDPDADRLAIVDENGRYIGEEYTLALAAKLLYSRKKGKAATNLSTSRMIDDIASAAGGEVLRTPVGEANVANTMVENGCIIGGEGNGSVIDLRVGPVRDSLVGMALILQLMADTGKSISELADEIGTYYMNKDKFAADKKQAEKIIDKAKKFFPDAKLNTSDGCRFDFDDGWFHLRTSNTEPVMRMIVEATDEKAAKKYIDAVNEIRKNVLG